MMTIDRAVLRLMAYCLCLKETPAVILINEGIELLKGLAEKMPISL